MSIRDMIQLCKELHATGRMFPVEFSNCEWDVFNAIVEEFHGGVDFGFNSLEGEENTVAFIFKQK